MNKTEKQAELDRLAHKIALSAVQSDIESFCVPERWSGKHFGTWYSPAIDAEEVEREIIDNAIRYAELKGILQRNPEKPSLVRIGPSGDC